MLEEYLSDSLKRLPEGLGNPAIALLSRMVTPSGTRNVVSEYDLISQVQEDEGISEERLKNALRALVPAFMLSELRRAFEIGFLLFLPFLIIDMVIAAILTSMGMMMLPPLVVSLPFKLIFFVLVDGWWLVVGSLVRSYGG